MRIGDDRDEFEVDETTPEGLRSVSSHSVVVVQSVAIKPFGRAGYWSDTHTQFIKKVKAANTRLPSVGFRS